MFVQFLDDVVQLSNDLVLLDRMLIKEFFKMFIILSLTQTFIF